MSKKFAALLVLSGSYLLALGFNCIPNVGNIAALTNLFGTTNPG